MLGTILYAALDISLNATIWVIKNTSNGIYYGVNYLLGNEVNQEKEDLNNILMIKIEEQNVCIRELKDEMIEIKKSIS